MSWRTALALVLLGAAVLSGWSVWQQRERPAQGVGDVMRPDYLLYDFEIVTLNEQGGESFTLRAPRLARNPADRTLTLTTPLFLFPDRDANLDDGNGGHWQVRSRDGWVSANADEVRLRGDVRATPPVGGSQQFTFATQQLDVFPNANRATTKAPVTITSGRSIIQGTGLEVGFDTKQYTILSESNAKFFPR